MANFMKWLSIIVFSLVTCFAGEGVLDGTFIISIAIFFAGYLIYKLIYWADGDRLEILILLTFSIICTVLLVQTTGDLKWIFIMLINIVSGYANAYFSDDYDYYNDNNNDNDDDDNQ